MFIKIDEQELELVPVSAAEFAKLEPVIGIPVVYNIDDPTKVWPRPSPEFPMKIIHKDDEPTWQPGPWKNSWLKWEKPVPLLFDEKDKGV